MSLSTVVWIRPLVTHPYAPAPRGPHLRADVTLPAVLAEHMVLQRGLPVHIWGSADPGESVAVEFRGETRSATADRPDAGACTCAR